MDIRRKSHTFIVSVGLLMTLLLPVSCASSEAATTGEVYICTGPMSNVYHSRPDCKGLNKCSGTIKKVSKSSTNRRGCKICTRLVSKKN